MGLLVRLRGASIAFRPRPADQLSRSSFAESSRRRRAKARILTTPEAAHISVNPVIIAKEAIIGRGDRRKHSFRTKLFRYQRATGSAHIS